MRLQLTILLPLTLAFMTFCDGCNRKTSTPGPAVKQHQQRQPHDKGIPPSPRPTEPPPGGWLPVAAGPVNIWLPYLEAERRDPQIEDVGLEKGVVRREGQIVGLDLLDRGRDEIAELMKAHASKVSTLAGDMKTLCSPDVQRAWTAGDSKSKRLSLRVHEYRFGKRAASCLRHFKAAEVLLELPWSVKNKHIAQLAMIKGIRGLMVDSGGLAASGSAPWSVTHGAHNNALADHQPRLTDKGMASIALFEGLEVLLLPWQHRVGDRGMPKLASISSLRVLDLMGTAVTDAGVAVLASPKSTLSKLQRLGLAYTKITDAAMAHIARFERLRTLDLTRTRISGKALAQLQGMKTLRDLRISSTNVDDKGLAHLARLELQGLDLRATRVTDAGLAHLAGMTTLRRLWLPKKITDAGLEHLDRLTGLELLEIEQQGSHYVRQRTGKVDDYGRDIKITDAGLARLVRLKSLHALVLHFTNITDKGLKQLATLAALRRLDIRSTLITDAGVMHLGKLEQLHHLNLGDNVITEAGLAGLRRLTTLRYLHLPTYTLDPANPGSLPPWKSSDVALGHLSALKNLRGLNLTGCKASAAGLARITGLTRLRTLSLGAVDDEGLCKLQSMNELLSLSFEPGDLNVTPKGVGCLAANMKSLAMLDLGRGGRINYQAIISIARIPGLRTLAFCAPHNCRAYGALCATKRKLSIWRRCKVCLNQAFKCGGERYGPLTGPMWHRLPS